MIVDPRTFLMLECLPLRQRGIRLFPREWVVRPMETIVPLGGAVRTDIDRYVLIRKNLTIIFRRGGGGAWAPADETAVCCVRLDDFDWVKPCRVPDMLVSVCAPKGCLSVRRHVK